MFSPAVLHTKHAKWNKLTEYSWETISRVILALVCLFFFADSLLLLLSERNVPQDTRHRRSKLINPEFCLLIFASREMRGTASHSDILAVYIAVPSGPFPDVRARPLRGTAGATTTTVARSQTLVVAGRRRRGKQLSPLTRLGFMTALINAAKP